MSRKYASFLTRIEAHPPTNDQTLAADLVCRKEDADPIVDAALAALSRGVLPREVEGFSEKNPVAKKLYHLVRGAAARLERRAAQMD